jgi:hypothetical protein
VRSTCTHDERDAYSSTEQSSEKSKSIYKEMKRDKHTPRPHNTREVSEGEREERERESERGDGCEETPNISMHD